MDFDYESADYALSHQAVLDAEEAEMEWQDEHDAALAEREWAYAGDIWDRER